MYHFTCTLNSQGWSLKNNFKFDLKNILMIFLQVLEEPLFMIKKCSVDKGIGIHYRTDQKTLPQV